MTKADAERLKAKNKKTMERNFQQYEALSDMGDKMSAMRQKNKNEKEYKKTMNTNAVIENKDFGYYMSLKNESEKILSECNNYLLKFDRAKQNVKNSFPGGNYTDGQLTLMTKQFILNGNIDLDNLPDVPAEKVVTDEDRVNNILALIKKKSEIVN
jgi:hypothetical protein